MTLTIKETRIHNPYTKQVTRRPIAPAPGALVHAVQTKSIKGKLQKLFRLVRRLQSVTD
jgi:hypothetical protein